MASLALPFISPLHFVSTSQIRIAGIANERQKYKKNVSNFSFAHCCCLIFRRGARLFLKFHLHVMWLWCIECKPKFVIVLILHVSSLLSRNNHTHARTHAHNTQEKMMPTTKANSLQHSANP